MSQMEQGPPPGLLEMLSGGAGAGAAPPPEEAGEGDSAEHEPIQILQQILKLGQRYMDVEPDAVDKAAMAKLMATLHQALAKDQQDAEAALGGGPATRILRKLG